MMVAQWVNPFLLYFQIYMTKTECEVVNPSKPISYKCFVDDIINRRNKNQADDFSETATIQT